MWHALKTTVNEFLEDNCMRLAAALAYYTVFSLPPLLVVVISVIGLSGLVTEDVVSQRLSSEIRSVVGEGGAQQVQTMIEHASHSDRGLWGTIIGAIVLVFGATGVMVQLQDSLNEAWDVQPENQTAGVMGFFIKRLLSLGMILAFAFLLLVSLLITTVLKGLGDQVDVLLPGPWGDSTLVLLNSLVSFAVIACMFAVLYKFLPDRDVAWRHVWLGAVITALLFVLAKWGLGLYLGRSDVASTYGAAGALALILLWVYYSAIIFLLGAEFTQVWGRRHETGSDASQPLTPPDPDLHTTPGTHEPQALLKSR